MSGRKSEDYQPGAQIKQMFQEGKLKAGTIRQSKSFLKNTSFQERLLQIKLSIKLTLK